MQDDRCTEQLYPCAAAERLLLVTLKPLIGPVVLHPGPPAAPLSQIHAVVDPEISHAALRSAMLP